MIVTGGFRAGMRLLIRLVANAGDEGPYPPGFPAGSLNMGAVRSGWAPAGRM
jgi:hypothetical protein